MVIGDPAIIFFQMYVQINQPFKTSKDVSKPAFFLYFISLVLLLISQNKYLSSRYIFSCKCGL